MTKKKKVLAALAAAICVLGMAASVKAERILIDYTSPNLCTYSVRKTDMESRFYVTVISANRTGVLMCQSQNVQDPLVGSDTLSISLSPGMAPKTESGTYRKLAPNGIYSLRLRCSILGMNVRLYYTP